MKMKELKCVVKKVRNDIVVRPRKDIVKRLVNVTAIKKNNDFSSFPRTIDESVVYDMKINLSKPSYQVFTNKQGNVVSFSGYSSEDVSKIKEYQKSVHELAEYKIEEVTKDIPERYKYISPYLLNEMNEWSKGSYIFLTCGTGKGKTTFVKHLIEMQKFNVLFLTNRIATREQAKVDFFATSWIWLNDKTRVISYQSFESMDNLNQNYLERFHYICVDECHYMHEDADFQAFTNATYQRILHTQKPVKILMSATPESITYKIFVGILQNRVKLIDGSKICRYKTKYNNSIVDKIVGFRSIDALAIKIAKSEEKWMIFVTSEKEANDITESLIKYNVKKEEIVFISRNAIQSGDEKAVASYNKAIAEMCIEERIVICTKIVDNGLSIKDIKLKNIVLFANDKTEVIQQYARKRCMNEQDHISIYVYEHGYQNLSVLIDQIKKKLKNYDLVKKELSKTKLPQKAIRVGYDHFREGLYKNPITKELEFNELGYEKLLQTMMIIEQMKEDRSQLFLKIQWIQEDLKIKAPCYILQGEREIKLEGELNKLCEFKINRFVSEINQCIGLPIELCEKEKRVLIAGCFKWIFGKKPQEKYNRPYTIDELKMIFEEENLPLSVEKISAKKFVIQRK